METRNFKTPLLLIYVLILQAIVCIALVLDIPIVRQVLGFLYLVFIPGFLLLRIFCQENFNITETLLLSVGLSFVFLMFIGLLTNELGSVLTSKPLSTETLAMFINIAVILMCVICYLRNKEDFNCTVPKSPKALLLIMSYIFLPILSVFGAMSVIAFKNNFLLILILIAITLLFILSATFRKLSPYYPLTVVSIATALLLSTFLSSKYISGHDFHLEYLIFRVTRDVSYWNRSGFLYTMERADVYNSMLSITVLPTIFSNILNVEETLIFKILYPLAFSLVPLVLYEIYQKKWGEKAALISVFFFMSNTVFFDPRDTAKLLIADLFYMLFFLVLWKEDLNRTSKWMILMCFGFGLIVSYYALTYIFLFLIFSTWLCGKIFAKNANNKITLSMIVFFFVLTFLWYIYGSYWPFNRLVSFLNGTFKSFFQEFFVAESRGSRVLYATGVLSTPSFLHDIGRLLHNITELFILIGFIVLIVKVRKKGVDPEHLILISVNMATLLMCVIVPNFTYALSMDKMYHVTLLFLSPLFVLGGISVFESIFKILRWEKEKKRKTFSLTLILILLATFFLFQTGVIYEIAKDPVPSSIPLSRYRMSAYNEIMLGLVHENDYFGAIWLSKNGNITHTQIYSDVKSATQVLTDTLVDLGNKVNLLSNKTVFTATSYIYLSRYNLITGILIYDPMSRIKVQYNITEIYIFNSTTVLNNKLYSNGACEIYYYVPR